MAGGRRRENGGSSVTVQMLNTARNDWLDPTTCPYAAAEYVLLGQATVGKDGFFRLTMSLTAVAAIMGGHRRFRTITDLACSAG